MKTSRIPQHIGALKPTGIPKATDTPSRVVLPQARASSRTLLKPIHPRYSIFAHGCSNSVYKVIREEGRDMYQTPNWGVDPSAFST